MVLIVQHKSEQRGTTLSTSVLSTERDRSKIPEEFLWDLSPVFPDFAAWTRAKEAFVKELPRLDSFRGTLGNSAAHLRSCLDAMTGLGKEYARLYTYASAHADIDTRSSDYLACQQEISQLGTEMSARTAFLEPELLRLGREQIDRFLSADAGLAVYGHMLDDVLRRKDHTGTESEEHLIAEAGLMADSSGSIYTVFSNADFPFAEITLSDGKTVRLDKAAFPLYRTVPNREDRKKVFEAYFGKLHEYRRTFGTQLYSEVKKNLYYQRVRKYPSCLHSALHAQNIPVDVYQALIAHVREALPLLHRYLDLRRRLLGVDVLHYYDLYAHVVPELMLEYGFAEARDLIVDSLTPLGEEYTSVAARAFAERWMDVYPSEGKIGGAYSNGSVYDAHPYILLNYNGKYDDVSTVAHELGHTMHSYLSNARQPYATSQYSIFVAEVASTFNEALLLEWMLKTVSDARIRLTLLMNYLDGLKATVFRQTQFAEFELRIHERAEAGQSLTGDSLEALYGELTREYYGHAQGVCVVDEGVQAEWAGVPHFYYNFYVFQYATSLTASSALSEMILEGDTVARKRYLELLSAGGSDYPIALLRRSGVDMTTPDPFRMLMRRMERAMKDVEKLLAEIRTPG
ncbi:MAG: oligopeptidase Metallo peptidase, family [Bacteroidetes bacterium]|jgi:oligoendopeptidase F|nr:oligopeptidase Metallo peptidase, family [Bacteroidota bacterium]